MNASKPVAFRPRADSFDDASISPDDRLAALKIRLEKLRRDQEIAAIEKELHELEASNVPATVPATVFVSTPVVHNTKPRPAGKHSPTHPRTSCRATPHSPSTPQVWDSPKDAKKLAKWAHPRVHLEYILRTFRFASCAPTFTLESLSAFLSSHPDLFFVGEDGWVQNLTKQELPAPVRENTRFVQPSVDVADELVLAVMKHFPLEGALRFDDISLPEGFDPATFLQFFMDHDDCFDVEENDGVYAISLTDQAVAFLHPSPYPVEAGAEESHSHTPHTHTPPSKKHGSSKKGKTGGASRVAGPVPPPEMGPALYMHLLTKNLDRDHKFLLAHLGNKEVFPDMYFDTQGHRPVDVINHFDKLFRRVGLHQFTLIRSDDAASAGGVSSEA